MSEKPVLQVLSKEEFERRELITTVQLDGRHEPVEVRIPLMGDVMPFMHEGGTQPFVMKLVAVACNMSWEEFMTLSYFDGMKLIEPLGKFLEALQKYKEQVHILRQTKLQ